MELVLLALTLVGIVAILRFLSRAHTVVTLEDGQLHAVRGKLPPGLSEDLAEMAAADPTAKARIALKGSRHRLEVETTVHAAAAGESLDQRVRNAVSAHKNRLR